MRLLVALALVFWGVVLWLKGASVRRKRAVRGDVMRELRVKAIQQQQEELGLTVARDEAFSIVMDVAFPTAVASLMSALTGDASIYYGTGGGVFGGIGHESVRTTAIAFVRKASKSVQMLTPATEFPYPGAGAVRFYVTTPGGVRAGEALEAQLRANQDALSPLYHAGQNVITELRLISEQLHPV